MPLLLPNRSTWPILPLAAAALAAMLGGCGDDPPTAELRGEALGTTFSIQLVVPEAGFDRRTLRDGILESLEDIDRQFSTWRDDSEISRFNASRDTGWQDASADVCRAVARALAISAATGGAFDITVAPLVEAWGFGARPAARKPEQGRLRSLQRIVGYENVETDCLQPALRKREPELAIDLSGYAKGLAADVLAQVIEARGLGRYLVEIGGEIRARGHNSRNRPWTIAIEHPLDPDGEPVALVPVWDGGLATSGDYRNTVEYDGDRYSHILDPRSGRPVANDLTSVTVLADSAADADAYATALLVLGRQEGLTFARQAGLAALLQFRNAGGLEQLTTPAFDSRTASR